MDSDPAQERFDRLAAIHQERFKQAFYDALSDLHTYYVATSHLYRPGEKATLMHVHVRDRMKQNFDGVPGVKIDDKSGRAFKVHLDGAPYDIPAKAEFKCQKLTKKLLTANIRTRAVRRFEKGLPEAIPRIQPSFEDWREPETTGGVEPGHGVAGYIIDALWLNFERLCITCFTGERSARLSVEIPLGGDGNATVINLPLGDIHEITPRKRVKPRKKKEDVAEPNARPKKHIKLEPVESEEQTRKKARNNGEDS
jgi:hypothetical protein